MMVEITLGLSITISLVSLYVNWNLMRKTELLETWVEDFTQTIETINRELKEIDAKGSFESDDETGAIFKQIQDTIKQLDSYKGEEE